MACFGMKGTTLLRLLKRRFGTCLTGSVVIWLGLLSCSARADLVYQENFDGLTPGHTQPFPGAPGQGGWYSALAQGNAFGEIEGAIAHPGQALHEFTPTTNPPDLQTIDARAFTAVDVTGSPLISLGFDFYAHTSALGAVNSFIASMSANGGPDPGFQILGADLVGGNGTPKLQTGVSVSLAAFNGTDNNDPITLTVGQQLTFDTWHRVSVILDQIQDRYISLTVDGQTQDLSAFRPPRSFDQGQALRGHLIEQLDATIIPSDVGGDRTNDDIYWDNVRLTAITGVPEPSSLMLLGTGSLGLIGLSLALRNRNRVRGKTELAGNTWN